LHSALAGLFAWRTAALKVSSAMSIGIRQQSGCGTMPILTDRL
jgi:hypothetical protein